MPKHMIFIFFIGWIWAGIITGFNLSQTMFPLVVDTTPVVHVEKQAPSIAEKIVIAAEASGINPATAIRIANCESKLGTQNYNKQGSSAKGVYQFINSTWAKYCDGDVLNEDDNIACFMKLYKQHPSWWSCK